PVPLSPAPPPPPMLGRPVPLAPAPALQGLTPLGSPAPTPPGSPGPLTYTPPHPADPGSDGWGPYGPPSSLPALFFDAEVTFLKPTLKTRTNAPILANGARLPVPSVRLDTTVSPLLELGYRLPDSCGQLSLAYRFFSAEGNGARSINGVMTPV